MPPPCRSRLRLTDLPEFNVAIFALLLNWPWEFLQVPFYGGMPSGEHWQGVKACARASLGDAVIMLIAYWGVATRGGRYWLLRPNPSQMTAFLAVGLAITVSIEKLALAGRWMGGWTYSTLMVIVPVLEVGLMPVLQWIVLPPLVIWFCKRQLSSGVEAIR